MSNDTTERSFGTDNPASAIALPALTDLAAYRIAQEAMTNARKHAPGSVIEVTLAWTPHELRLKVVNTPSPITSPEHRGEGTGHGILGMRERAHAAHGTLTIGPTPGDGFRVIAKLPITTQESS